MIGLLQRVSSASVRVGGKLIGEIDRGLLVLVGIEKGDCEDSAKRLAERLGGYRVFPDVNGKMNLSLLDIGGKALLVPQFTLAADTDKGMRPSFHLAAEPDRGKSLFEYVCRCLEKQGVHTARGEFGADMQVSLVNEGPATFCLRVGPDT